VQEGKAPGGGKLDRRGKGGKQTWKEQRNWLLLAKISGRDEREGSKKSGGG